MEASFSLENLICHLYRDDLGPRPKEPNLADKYLKSFQVAVEAMARKGRRVEQIPVRPIPDDLSPQRDQKLFHERVHYWQLLSASTLQYRFTLLLDKLHIGAISVGGQADLICGQRQLQSAVDPEEINTSLASMDSNFRHVRATPEMISLPNILSRDPFTDMPLCYFPHVLGGTIRLPGYAAGLGFKGKPGAVLVPLGGYNLMESAAYVAELLYAGQSVPRPSALETEEAQLYLGPWEFWARLHEADYDSQTDLVLSYLAAVDYALHSDILGPVDDDTEYRYEMLSVPYRFGKLAYQMRGEGPLRSEGREPSVAIAEYQARMAEVLAWPSPQATTRKMAAFLTKLLVKSHAHRISTTPENLALAEWLFGTPAADLADDMDRLQAAWTLASSLRDTKYETGQGYVWPLGQSIIGTMLNACIARLRRPGELAAPHLYHARYKRLFPLPVVLVDGNYCVEDPVPLPAEEHPYPCSASEVLYDCIGLAALSPLEKGNVGCGFAVRRCGCYFTGAGLVCPSEQTVTADGDAIPATPAGTWCHWTLRSLVLGTAPESIRKAWGDVTPRDALDPSDRR
jgi:hypothetical protein